MASGKKSDLVSVVIDNGAHTLKYGVVGGGVPGCGSGSRPRKGRGKGWGEPVAGVNGVAKSRTGRRYVGGELAALQDVSGLLLRRGFEKGYVVNWELESEVWAQALGEQGLDVAPAECALVTSEKLFCPPSLQQASLEALFEGFGFASIAKKDPSVLAWHDHSQQIRTGMSGAERIGNGAERMGGGGGVEEEATRGRAHYIAQCGLVIDCGYSACTATPILQGFPVNFAAKRMDVGGRALTNYLKELVSFRQYNMDEEALLLDRVKARYCYVSPDFASELRSSKRAGPRTPMRRVFPISQVAGWESSSDEEEEGAVVVDDAEQSGHHSDAEEEEEEDKPVEVDLIHARTERKSPQKKAAASSPSAKRNRNDRDARTPQLMTMTTERICVPELLFHPSDIGISQGGLDELVIHSVAATNEYLHAPLYSNIFVYGGSSSFPGLAARLQSSLRTLVPDQFPLRIHFSQRPTFAPWYGAAALIQNDPEFLATQSVSREEYQERGWGHIYASRKFALG